MTAVPRKATTEALPPGADQLQGASTAELLAALSDADQGVPGVVATQLPQIGRVVDETVARLRRGGRVRYFGAGTSGRLATLDAAEIPPTFGVSPGLVEAHLAGGRDAVAGAIEGAEDSVDAGRREALAAVDEADVAIGVAASGETPYVRSAMAAARERGCYTACIVCASGSSLAAEVDQPIELPVGPEVLAGSTRLKAGTAQKLALNMISTAVFWRLGHVYRSRMVDVRVTNSKLRRRAIEMVADLAGCDRERAEEVFDQAGTAKLAVLMLRTGLELEAAEARLAETGGDLGRALGDD
jgi:N-acetylmuramic acid 6-phosphate etherase